MPLSSLTGSATGCTSITSISVEEAYSTLSASCVVECNSTTLSIGDEVTTVILGTTVHYGYCKRIERMWPECKVAVTVNDPMIRAIDYFMASDDPEVPFQRNNIGTLQLIKDLLSEAGLTLVTGSDKPFTWGTNPDGARFNLQSVADAVNFIVQMVGDTIYYDRTTGYITVADRKPYPDGDTPAGTWTTGASGNIVSVHYSESSDKIRNRIVVYGKTPIRAEASASNPYLVVDQTAAIAHELIDTQTIADGAASVNLALLNRLERKAEVDLIGDPAIAARQVYTIQEPSFIGLNEDAFAYKVSHTLTDSGYTVSVTATM